MWWQNSSSDLFENTRGALYKFWGRKPEFDEHKSESMSAHLYPVITGQGLLNSLKTSKMPYRTSASRGEERGHHWQSHGFQHLNYSAPAQQLDSKEEAGRQECLWKCLHILNNELLEDPASSHTEIKSSLGQKYQGSEKNTSPRKTEEPWAGRSRDQEQRKSQITKYKLLRSFLTKVKAATELKWWQQRRCFKFCLHRAYKGWLPDREASEAQGLLASIFITAPQVPTTLILKWRQQPPLGFLLES